MHSIFFRILAILSLLLLLTSCDKHKTSFQNSDITGAAFGRELALTDHTGKLRTLDDFKGKVSVLFFGYTLCPDACPTTLSTLREVLDKLGKDANRVQVLFVTIDPERDTQEILAQYVPAFHPTFLGLRGDAEATDKVSKEFKVITHIVPGASPTAYTVDHSTGVYIFDPAGKLRLYAGHGSSADAFLNDIKKLLP